MHLGDRGRGLTLRQACAYAPRRLTGTGRAGSCDRAVPHAPGLRGQLRPSVCPSWRPESPPSAMETARQAPSWWTLCPAGREGPSYEQGERPSRGGGMGGGVRNRERGSPGSRQLVKNQLHFLLGENEAQITHLVQGHTAARWQSWHRGSWAGIEGTYGNQASKERAPKHTGSQNHEAVFQRQHEPSQPRGGRGRPAPSWSCGRLGSLWVPELAPRPTDAVPTPAAFTSTRQGNVESEMAPVLLRLRASPSESGVSLPPSPRVSACVPVRRSVLQPGAGDRDPHSSHGLRPFSGPWARGATMAPGAF